jgi:hypothetical protein
MANSKLHRKTGSIFPALIAGFALLTAWPSLAGAQQVVNGFAVERFYPSAPGGGWFVMDDLSMSGGLGGAISLTGGDAVNFLRITGPDGKQRLTLVSQDSFVDLGLAVTYDRYKVLSQPPGASRARRDEWDTRPVSIHGTVSEHREKPGYHLRYPSWLRCATAR